MEPILWYMLSVKHITGKTSLDSDFHISRIAILNCKLSSLG